MPLPLEGPGKDGIAPEAMTFAEGTLIKELHEILCQCWREGTEPQDLRDDNVVTVYGNEGDMCDSNNYRGIPLLSIVGKHFARVVLRRLQDLAERVYPESQYGFSAEVSTADMVFSLRRQQEKLQGAKTATVHGLHRPRRCLGPC